MRSPATKLDCGSPVRALGPEPRQPGHPSTLGSDSGALPEAGARWLPGSWDPLVSTSVLGSQAGASFLLRAEGSRFT